MTVDPVAALLAHLEAALRKAVIETKMADFGLSEDEPFHLAILLFHPNPTTGNVDVLSTTTLPSNEVFLRTVREWLESLEGRPIGVAPGKVH